MCRLPVGTLSALILGPGTTVTHAAIKAAAQCNCPLFWLGEDGLRFYAFGITPNHDNSMARVHAAAWAAPQKRNEIARRMFRFRFPDVPSGGVSIKQLRGMEAGVSNSATKNSSARFHPRSRYSTCFPYTRGDGTFWGDS